MNNVIAAASFKKAEDLAVEVTTFYAKSVGRGIDALAEFSLLVDWLDACNAAIFAAISIRDDRDDAHFCAMRSECNTYLDLWHAAK